MIQIKICKVPRPCRNPQRRKKTSKAPDQGTWHLRASDLGRKKPGDINPLEEAITGTD